MVASGWQIALMRGKQYKNGMIYLKRAHEDGCCGYGDQRELNPVPTQLGTRLKAYHLHRKVIVHAYNNNGRIVIRLGGRPPSFQEILFTMNA